ncbi:MAG TPA: NAD(+) kinase [Woeseiaceae bacterium]|nr:NAD(+) kinase [Woeseiaceae bacterium]
MSTTFQTVAVFGRHTDPRVAEPMTALAGFLVERGVDVLVSADVDLEIAGRRTPEDKLAPSADLMIVVGGDGTMLYATRLAVGHSVPLLGINRGRLGFLTDVTPEAMLTSVGAVLEGDYSRETRLLLAAELQRPDGTHLADMALNDVVLARRETGRMVDYETWVDNRYVNTHSGDGLIVATPTGSTAYALSCGGPIVQPDLDAMVLVPVCPHTLSDRPIVIPAACEVQIRLLERPETRGEITCDGYPLGALEDGDKLLVRSAEHRITLIHPPGHDYYEILRSKLNWGRDSRVRRTIRA